METPFTRPYTIHIQGPDMDIRFYVQDEHDLNVLDLILTKIRKKVLLPTPIIALRSEATD